MTTDQKDNLIFKFIIIISGILFWSLAMGVIYVLYIRPLLMKQQQGIKIENVEVIKENKESDIKFGADKLNISLAEKQESLDLINKFENKQAFSYTEYQKYIKYLDMEIQSNREVKNINKDFIPVVSDRLKAKL